ncbi:MAG: alpha/beta hydrolase, partial [Gammaproteobacteria bacterium]|nr:alpha/beta hydrolase [Gammaproteobacteria bacterium]
RYQRRVITLWLLAPAGAAGAAPSDMMQRIEAGEAPPLFARSHEQFIQVLGYVTAKPPFIPGAVRDLLADRAIADHDLHTRIFDELWRERPALEPVADRIQAPTLIVWGEADRVLHPSGAKILEKALPTAEANVLPGIGHLPQLEAPGECAELFRSFVSRFTQQR